MPTGPGNWIEPSLIMYLLTADEYHRYWAVYHWQAYLDFLHQLLNNGGPWISRSQFDRLLFFWNPSIAQHTWLLPGAWAGLNMRSVNTMITYYSKFKAENYELYLAKGLITAIPPRGNNLAVTTTLGNLVMVGNPGRAVVPPTLPPPGVANLSFPRLVRQALPAPAASQAPPAAPALPAAPVAPAPQAPPGAPLPAPVASNTVAFGAAAPLTSARATQP